MNKLFEILELMKLNDKVLIFDCFGVLVLGQPSSEHIFEYEWKKDPNLINFIREKKTQGSKIGVLSNVAQYQFDQFFSKKEQEELFDFLVFSGEVGFLKPSQEIFEIAIHRANVPPKDIYFFDDSYMNIEAAKKIGLNGVLYQNWSEFSQIIKEGKCQNYQR